jgi:hypothetical protein
MERSIFFLLTNTMHSAKDKHFRSFLIGTEVLSFADSKAESSSSHHMNMFKEEGSLAAEFDIESWCCNTHKSKMHSVTVHDLSNVAHIYDESQVLHAAACIKNTLLKS